MGDILALRKNNIAFTPINNLLNNISRSSNNIINFINELIDEDIISSFQIADEKYLINEDVELCSKLILKVQYVKDDEILLNEQINFSYVTVPLINNNTIFDKSILKNHNKKLYNSLFKNILKYLCYDDNKECNDNDEYEIFNLFPYRIVTSSSGVKNIINDFLKRSIKIGESYSSQFAESASYMGSKKGLAGFLIEGINYTAEKNSKIVDLMCGSGAASSSFNLFWKTLSSDAQSFCMILAKIQGGGYSDLKAKRTIDWIVPYYNENIRLLERKLSKFIKLENDIFHVDSLETALQKYKNLLNEFPTYPSLESKLNWSPVKEIRKRNKDVKITPYCLYTCYFANIYFGIRQAIEIDSIRYAIENLKDKKDKLWAFGALIATVSKMGTTYGGHFAQPKFKNSEAITKENLLAILDKRQQSIFHEFIIRFLNLSEESKKQKNEIDIIEGPWKVALQKIIEEFPKKDIIVYLDAPYKREEYSRYYHVLETLIEYNYPSSVGIGKTPDIRKGERFSSEFSTRNIDNLNSVFIEIISNILEANFICAWSYSNTGSANIFTIINSIKSKYNPKIDVFSSPFMHKSHKGYLNKQVIEYLIIFSKI